MEQTLHSSVKATSAPLGKGKQDEAIIGTNDYSIVSKRSVEKLYFSSEPQFLRPFVAKVKRRAPLINRGYWLRMRAIEHVVKAFIDEECSKSKVIVNLGCGYEPLPFRMMWKYGSLCAHVRFVDVDYPQLMHKKVEILRKNKIFFDLLKGGDHSFQTKTSSRVLINDQVYNAVACDLGDIAALERIFRDELQLTDRSVLFIGEVSVVYMEVGKADKLIEWTSRFEDARFCLLEQHLPAGPSHPFAKTMLEHFQKQTPLRCLASYPLMSNQRQRFLKRNWTRVSIVDLWSLWRNQAIISDAERCALDQVEPFDEWEELILFASHYFLLLASTRPSEGTTDSKDWSEMSDPISKPPIGIFPSRIEVHTELSPRGRGSRRFGAIMKVNAETVVHHGGLTDVARKVNHDTYTCLTEPAAFEVPPKDSLCHTITTLHDGTILLVGGRNSPARASSECWLKDNDGWTRTHDLSPARYRHCSVPVKVGSISGALVFGGKTSDATVLDECVLFDRVRGWRRLETSASLPPALFGAAMLALDDCSGLLSGGIGAGGEVGVTATGLWNWKLVGDDDDLRIEMTQEWCENPDPKNVNPSKHARFGASLMLSRWGVLLIGGVGLYEIVPPDEEILALTLGERSKERHERITNMSKFPHLFDSERPRPLLVGFAATVVQDDNVLIVGGSAVCFSFGAYWNEKSYLLCPIENESSLQKWSLVVHTESSSQQGVIETEGAIVDELPPKEETEALQHATAIHECHMPTAQAFQNLIAEAHPAVISGMDLGPCTELWTPTYLKAKIGQNRPVIIHSSTTQHMSFQPRKNFTYEKQAFGRFLDAAMSGSHVYLRSLSSKNVTKDAANLARDFGGIAPDFRIPEVLQYAQQNEHSSVLRISGKVNMWLHYDVMANILCQIQGTKRIILFPPDDISLLDFTHGESTSHLDIFTAEDGSLHRTHPVETVLKKGDILFIPPFWSHATAPADEHGSVAVNVFFRSLVDGYAAGRDVYGNRDLEVYQNGRRDVHRIVTLFAGCGAEEKRIASQILTPILRDDVARGSVVDGDGKGKKEVFRILRSMDFLPGEVARFYRHRLADELLFCLAGAR